jgi:hypothetical protein
MLDVDYFSAHHALHRERASPRRSRSTLGWAVSKDKGPFNGDRALAGGARARRRRGDSCRTGDRLGLVRAAFTARGLPPQIPECRVALERSRL